MEGLDNYLTNEPDNGYQKWESEVMKIVSEKLPDSYDIDDDKTIDLLLKLSVSGTRRVCFVKPDFAADVIIRRCKIKAAIELLTKGEKL